MITTQKFVDVAAQAVDVHVPHVAKKMADTVSQLREEVPAAQAAAKPLDVPNAKQVAAPAHKFTVGDAVVVFWPSHRAHGRPGEVTGIYDDGKVATAVDGSTWCFPPSRL